MNAKYIIAAVCGCVSGFLSIVLADFIGSNTLVWFPGAVFGLIFTCYAIWDTKAYKLKKLFLWVLFIALSTGAYYSAVYVCSYLMNKMIIDYSELRLWLVGGVAGFLGSLILVVSIWLCSLKKPALNYSILTILFGSVLGSLVAYDGELGVTILFVPWQTVVFVCLALMLPETD